MGGGRGRGGGVESFTVCPMQIVGFTPFPVLVNG